jgi:RNA polymerase sigma factor (sigma-70 family)
VAFQLLEAQASREESAPHSVRGARSRLRLLGEDALPQLNDVVSRTDVVASQGSKELNRAEGIASHTQDDATVHKPLSEPPPSGVQRTGVRVDFDSLTDEDVISAVREGDQPVARLLHQRLLGVVDLTLYRIFGRREPDHDDLIQAVFEQIVRTLTLNSYSRACNLRTWAATIASHVAFTALRSRRRERRVFDRSVALDLNIHGRAFDGESAAAARYDLHHLRRHLIAMNPGRAQVLFLHDVQGEKLYEVARAMRITTAAATSRLVRARRELAQRLALESAREMRRQRRSGC